MKQLLRLVSLIHKAACKSWNFLSTVKRMYYINVTYCSDYLARKLLLFQLVWITWVPTIRFQLQNRFFSSHSTQVSRQNYESWKAQTFSMHRFTRRCVSVAELFTFFVDINVNFLFFLEANHCIVCNWWKPQNSLVKFRNRSSLKEVTFFLRSLLSLTTRFE